MARRKRQQERDRFSRRPFNFDISRGQLGIFAWDNGFAQRCAMCHHLHADQHEIGLVDEPHYCPCHDGKLPHDKPALGFMVPVDLSGRMLKIAHLIGDDSYSSAAFDVNVSLS